MKAIYFDLDGTLVDLYNVKDWESDLRKENVYPYLVAKPLVDMDELRELLEQLSERGITIGIISWGAMNCTPKFTRQTKQVKKMWIEQYLSCIDEWHVVKYGTPKYKVAKIKDSILIDDNAEVRKEWKGDTIDATKNILEELQNLLDKLKESIMQSNK